MKYKLIVLKMQDNRPIWIGEKTYDKKDGSIIIDKTHTVELSQLIITYVKDNTAYTFYDLTNDKFLTFNDVKTGIDSKLLDLIITKGVIAQIMTKIRNATEPINKSAIMMYIIIFGAGIAIGAMISMFVYPYVFPTPIQPIPTQPPTI